MRKHKFLAVLLAFIMALSLLPTAAFAEEAGETPADDPAGIPTALTEETVEDIAPQAEEYVAKIGDVGYATLGAAVNAVPVNGTAAITLLSDTTENVSVSYNEDITLDLGGHTLTGYVYVSRGTLTLENGTVSNPGSYAAAMTGSTSDTADYSILNVESTATVKGLWGACLFDKSNLGYGMVLNVAGTIDGDIFVQGLLGNTAESAEALAAGNAPVVNIKDGAVIKDDEGPGIAMNGYAIVNVENGASVTGTEAIAVKRGVLNITGGTFTATGEKQDPATANHNGTEATGAAISVTSTYNYAGKIEVNINGGRFTSQNNSALYVGHSVESNDSSNTYEKGLSIDIKDGQFTGADGADAVYIAKAADGDDVSYTQKVIRGGTFSSNISTYVVAGSAAILDEDNQNWTIGVDPDKTVVAVIGNTGYENLQAAVDAARSGETVTLLANTYLTETVRIGENQNITLNLNGQAVTVSQSDGRSLYAIKNYGTLTLTDDSDEGNGSITARGVENYGTMYMEGGTINSCDSNGGGAAVWNEGTFEMTDGALKFTGQKSGENAGAPFTNAKETASAKITGGTLESPYTAIFANAGKVEVENITLSTKTDYWMTVKTFSGSEITLTNVTINTAKGGCIEVAGGTATLENCTFTQSEEGDPAHVRSAVAVSNGGTVTVKSGTYTSSAFGAYVFNSGGTIHIEGGEFNAPTALKADASTSPAAPSKIDVSNGNFTGELSVASGADLSISGGTFSSDPTNYCIEDYTGIETADGQFIVAHETEALITIIGPTGEMENTPAITLDENKKVTAIQGKTTLFDPHDNSEAGDTLKYWVYNGWTFSAEKNGQKETFGTFKTLTAELAAWLSEKINDTEGVWKLTMDSRTPGYYSYPSSGGSSSGSSSTPTYAVTVDSGRHGTVTVSPKSARRGATVTITVKPDDGYELDDLTVTDKDGKTVKVTEGKNGKFTFTMPASKVEVEASFTAIKEETPARRFTDVPDGYWAEDEINWAADSGYMNGNTAATFNPEGTVTRQQLWMILARLSGYQPADFDEARAWAMDNSISDGTNPGGAVSRQQLVTILYRYAERMGHNTAGSADLTAYPDHAGVAAYATGAMGWSVANGIVGGTAQGTLAPTGTATRAQFAAILYRFCDKIAG
nr:S-layer homology domain-containing protein [uncultured Dysosmobacter sp.]